MLWLWWLSSWSDEFQKDRSKMTNKFLFMFFCYESYYDGTAATYWVAAVVARYLSITGGKPSEMKASFYFRFGSSSLCRILTGLWLRAMWHTRRLIKLGWLVWGGREHKTCSMPEFRPMSVLTYVFSGSSCCSWSCLAWSLRIWAMFFEVLKWK